MDRFSAETLNISCHPSGLKGTPRKKTANQEYTTRQSCPLFEEEIKSFADNQKIKDFIITRQDLQEMVKGLLKAKTKGC